MGDGCDCTELCEMGPTCPGGGLAGLPGSGCWRTSDHEREVQAAIEAVLNNPCHHCGRPPEPDGDHSCPCPHTDADCLDHPAARSPR